MDKCRAEGRRQKSFGLILRLFLDPCQFSANPTRYRCAKSNKGNSINRILEENETTQMTGNVTNDSGTGTDHGNGNNKAWVSAGDSYFGFKYYEEQCT